jgi:hypothetical protein
MEANPGPVDQIGDPFGPSTTGRARTITHERLGLALSSRSHRLFHCGTRLTVRDKHMPRHLSSD